MAQWAPPLSVALDLRGQFLGHYSGQEAVLDLTGGLEFVFVSRRPGLQPGVNALLQLIELQEKAIGPGGDDETGGTGSCKF